MEAHTKSAQPERGDATSTKPSTMMAPQAADKMQGRKSTPDSEALCSDDDSDQIPGTKLTTVQPQKPIRRASWLNDNNQSLARPRNGSFASASMSPTISHPATPSGDYPTSWIGHSGLTGTSLGRVGQGPSAFPWDSGIWTAGEHELRKETTARRVDCFTSATDPSTTVGNVAAHQGPASYESTFDATMPFAISLHPTPKTYRSQSYSVGQLDPLSNFVPGSGAHILSQSLRGRMTPLSSAMQHRPARPSMLSAVSSETFGLSRAKEFEDNAGRKENGGVFNNHYIDQAQAIEDLSRENAMLRQQYFTHTRPRSRHASASAASAAHGPTSAHKFYASVPEESEYAIDELDEVAELFNAQQRAPPRRYSEYDTGPEPLTALPAQISKPEMKKAHWQSSSGIDIFLELPRSRRHSFADVLSRQCSAGSTREDEAAKPPTEFGMPVDSVDPQHETQIQANLDYSSTYFSAPHNHPQQSAYGQNGHPHQVTAPKAYMHHDRQTPNVGHYGSLTSRQNQLLLVVLFKCSRPDVFYVHEGARLSVNPGDLVIVEADRGTDLGTVAHTKLDWNEAKSLKNHYAEEHYKWLMMYSQGAIETSDGTGPGLMAATSGRHAISLGGMGPLNPQAQDSLSAELKPKIVKRLAQPHELQALRDKEGNEAKAKRVCMQKVKEHGLHMEILDAEFQMDWKKLTFYYFADAYINFNSLVTDLFKIYKTRIWMSAINPASFAHPNISLQGPSSFGPGALIQNRPRNGDRRPTTVENKENFRSAMQRSYVEGLGAPFQPPAMEHGMTFPVYAHLSGFLSDQRSHSIEQHPGILPYGADFTTNRGAQASPGFAIGGDTIMRNGVTGIDHGASWTDDLRGLSLNESG